ncbi:MAG: HAMP domain-containing histidine kinase [Deltaproteobacteria bacterium]|nr:HAMP domain-containing histidine kinase [Deltaproteobacteria bacterium]
MVALLFVLIYHKTISYLEKETDTIIEIEINALSDQYQKNGIYDLVESLKLKLDKSQATSSIYLLTDSRFNSLLGNISQWPKSYDKNKQWVEFNIIGPDSVKQRIKAKLFLLQGGYYLLVGRNIETLKRTKQLILDAIIWGLLLTLLLGLLGGYFVSRGILQRITIITNSCREIIQGNLEKRIPQNHRHDEFDALAETMNTMLDRINVLMTGLKQVTDDIAHDLRTPLSRLRQSLEIGAKEDDPDKAHQIMQSCVEEVDGLLSTFNALLKIASIESSKQAEGKTKVNLQNLINDVYELYQPIAEEKYLHFHCLHMDEPIYIQTNRNLLFQALSNVIDNAIKYTPEHGEVKIKTSMYQDTIQLDILDTGVGIPASDLVHVHKRFYRSDQSRNKPGSGLGLSLVYAICRHLNIEISLENKSVGLKVTFLIKRISSTNDIHS